MAPTDEAPMSDGELKAVAAVLGIIGVLGIVNNTTTLYLVGRYSQLRTPFNMLVVNLTVSDLLVCILGIPFSFVSSWTGRWEFGHAGCVWYGFINSLLGIVSLITLTVISYERHQLMKRPPNAPKLSYRWVALSVVFVWGYSLLWTVPPLMGWSSYGPEVHGVACSVNWASRTANDTSYIVAFFVGCLAVPVTIIVMSYTRLILHAQQPLSDAIQPLPGAQLTAAPQQVPCTTRREKRLTKMVVVMVMCFLVCWLPYGIVALIVTFGGEGIITPEVAIVPALFAKSSVAYNAGIYVAMNSQFRKCFLISFKCGSQQQPDSTSQLYASYTGKSSQVGASSCSSQVDRTVDKNTILNVAASNAQGRCSSSPRQADSIRGFKKSLPYSFPLTKICPISEVEE
ncbi:OPN3 [Branchiostoma lanceolatum]|uniref:Opsin-3 n=1 Tax=Branchiostoma lanceolatum TaxID=7740 RepID=A0A8J9YWX6_BRALA|nr:OPN3 [Branchiostoma lanceolatum]